MSCDWNTVGPLVVVTPDCERYLYILANLFPLIYKVWQCQAFKGPQTESHQSYPSIAGIPFLSDQLLSTQVWDAELCCCCCCYYRGSTCPHSGMSDTITGSSRVPHIMWAIYNLHVNATRQSTLTLQGHVGLVESSGVWTSRTKILKLWHHQGVWQEWDCPCASGQVLNVCSSLWNTHSLTGNVMAFFHPCMQCIHFFI